MARQGHFEDQTERTFCFGATKTIGTIDHRRLEGEPIQLNNKVVGAGLTTVAIQGEKA